MSRLKRRSFIAAFVFALLCGTILQVPNGQVQAEEVSFDTIIRNGTILDGSGLPRYEAESGYGTEPLRASAIWMTIPQKRT